MRPAVPELVAYWEDGELVVPWLLADGRVIRLLTPEALQALPDGTWLVSISGREVEKKAEFYDLETRGGRTAYGVKP